MDTYPTFEEFLQLPVTEIAPLTPKSMMYVPGLSRRGAILAGIAGGDVYALWAMRGLMRTLDMLFQHGVEHIFLLQLSPANFKENTKNYRENLARWCDTFLTGEIAREYYHQGQWRLRMMYEEYWPEFQTLNQNLLAMTKEHHGPTLWQMFVPNPEVPTQWMLDKLLAHPCQTTAEAIQLLYGEPVPPIDLYLSFGKPIISPLPPLLAGKMHCYWGQFCTYDMTEAQLRAILYDCIYTRATWRADKQSRAKEALAYRAAWDPGPIVGLGLRLGSYWYPQPVPPPPTPTEVEA